MIPERLEWLVAGEGAPMQLAELFAAAGHELYVVGGSVRDLLLGNLPSDLDFTTSARPDEIKSIAGKWADAIFGVGEAFGTVGLRRGDHTYEITTFRSEVYRPESRKPEVTFSDDVETDLSRRDFTINAMALRVPEAQVVDPYDGLSDLAAGVLKTPIGSEASFGDDPLRMLRLFRFVSTLGLDPDQETLGGVLTMRRRLGIVSAERIQAELSKLMVGPHVAEALWGIVNSKLADEFLPELPALGMEQDPVHHHKDVLAHTVAVVAKTEPDLIIRLAALLHDIGKPATRKVSKGKISFHHHEVAGSKLAKARLRELRYPRQVVDDVSRLVFLHLRPHTFAMGWTDSAVRRYVRDAGPLLVRLNQLVRADVTTVNERRAAFIQHRIDELEQRIQVLSEKEELDALRPPIDGNDVMSFLRMSPGPQVGEVMRMLLEHRIEEGPFAPEEAYRMAREWALANGLEDPGDPPPS